MDGETLTIKMKRECADYLDRWFESEIWAERILGNDDRAIAMRAFIRGVREAKGEKLP